MFENGDVFHATACGERSRYQKDGEGMTVFDRSRCHEGDSLVKSNERRTEFRKVCERLDQAKDETLGASICLHPRIVAGCTTFCERLSKKQPECRLSTLAPSLWLSGCSLQKTKSWKPRLRSFSLSVWANWSKFVCIRAIDCSDMTNSRVWSREGLMRMCTCARARAVISVFSTTKDSSTSST